MVYLSIILKKKNTKVWATQTTFLRLSTVKIEIYSSQIRNIVQVNILFGI